MDNEPLVTEPRDTEPPDTEPLAIELLPTELLATELLTTAGPAPEGLAPEGLEIAGVGGPAERGSAKLGRYGEQLAARYLREQGLEIVERNWRCELGEIDIVALDGRCLVVCEVKTRRSTAFGAPITQVTVAKLARLRRLAGAWLREHDTHVDDVRIDVIGVLRPRRGTCELEHLVSVAS